MEQLSIGTDAQQCDASESDTSAECLNCRELGIIAEIVYVETHTRPRYVCQNEFSSEIV